MTRRLGAALAPLLVLPLVPAFAEPVDPTPPFIIELQNAIRNDDKTWLAEHLHLPVNYFGKTKQVICSKVWFLKHYATVIGPELKANVLKQDPGDYFENYEGMMLGDGGSKYLNRNFGDGRAGLPTRFEIITINNSD
jgi:hypothetical protein